MKKRIFLKGIRGRVLINEPLKSHTTFRIGGPCEAWLEPACEKDLKKILDLARAKQKKIFVIGSGSNVLPGDGGFKGIVVHLGAAAFKKARFRGARAQAGAGINLGSLVNMACKRSLAGLEGLAGIPGTLGGAIFMNAGCRSGIAENLERVRVMDKRTGKIREFKRENLKFKYRHSGLDKYIILDATLKLKRSSGRLLMQRKRRFLEAKRENQPLARPSAGCVFKNPKGKKEAAWYIERSGLKGRHSGGAGISEKHANFIVNLKNARARDVLRLMGLVKRKVKSRFNVELEPEIQILA